MQSKTGKDQAMIQLSDKQYNEFYEYVRLLVTTCNLLDNYPYHYKIEDAGAITETHKESNVFTQELDICTFIERTSKLLHKYARQERLKID